MDYKFEKHCEPERLGSSTASADEDATVRVNVTHADAVVDRIKEFVNQYNEIVEELNSALREEVFRDFPPLTDEQKAEMSDKEIELWEERARSGLLRSDRLISGVLSDMRLALGGAVEGLEEYKLGRYRHHNRDLV